MKYSISCLKSAFAALCESFAAIILNDFLQHWPRLLSWRILLSHCCLFFEAHKKNPFWQEKFPEEKLERPFLWPDNTVGANPQMHETCNRYIPHLVARYLGLVLCKEST
jgi:hypothetical protein